MAPELGAGKIGRAGSRLQPLLHTKRLDLLAATAEHLRCELDAAAMLATLLGAKVPASWPPGEYDRAALDHFYARLDAQGEEAVGWYLWYAMTRDDCGQRMDLVGGAGFFGPPSDGVVEIGYSLVPMARGRHYASEMVTALSELAFASGLVDHVIAHSAETNVASLGVLLRCGFERIATDHDAGTLLYRKSAPRCG